MRHTIETHIRKSWTFPLFSWLLWTLLLIIAVLIHAGASSSYYDILKVPKTASSSEIKKAYRKLALQHHPDKGGNEESFKEIQKAYEILSDPDQRILYDSYGEAGMDMNGGGANPFAANGAGGANPFAGGFDKNSFGGFGRNPGGMPPGSGFSSFSFGKGQGGTTNTNIDLSELLQQMMGGFGSGEQWGADVGGGENAWRSARGARPKKQNRSFTRPVKCTLEDLARGCSKKLKVQYAGQEKVFPIKIQPGWKEGTKIKYPSSGGFPAMEFQIQQVPHKFLRRDGNDLQFACWISESQTQGGIKVKVPLPTGEIWTKDIPKGKEGGAAVIQNGERLVIPNKGMPVKGGPERGDLIVTFRVRRSTTS